MEHDENQAYYRWENSIQASWESVQEDEKGRIIAVNPRLNERNNLRLKDSNITQSIRRGLIRYLIVVIDCSESAMENDYRPTRLEVSKTAVQKFIGEYFDQNPISQLSLMLTRNRISEKLTELSGNPKHHVQKLQSIMKTEGLASLQNTIILAIATLKHIPNYGHRELLILYSSLSTCDPGDIFSTVQQAQNEKLKINVICLAAEVYICKQICELTGGIFSVAIDTHHLSELLQYHTIPPPESDKSQTLITDFIYMGFPKRTFEHHVVYSFDGKKIKLSENNYTCPRCQSKNTDIPTQCCVCNLQLNSSSHIARSYHHLFPVPKFNELNSFSSELMLEMKQNEKKCYSCLDNLIDIVNGNIFMQCPTCKYLFCVDCDLYIHDMLHNCPGCN